MTCQDLRAAAILLPCVLALAPCQAAAQGPGTVPFFAPERPILTGGVPGEKGDCPPWADGNGPGLCPTVSIARWTWFDPRRDRQLPVKVYYPANAPGPLPVVIFSHGLGRSPDEYAYLGLYWARGGYVSVHLHHFGSDDAAWCGKLRPMKALRDEWEDPLSAVDRRRDMLLAIDQLERMHLAGTPLGRRLDIARLGVAGNDFGAQTALVVAGQDLPGLIIPRADPRVKAVLALSPPVPLGKVPLETAYCRICAPCLYITGTEDDGLVGSTTAPQRRLPFEYVNHTDQYLLTMQGADHMVYAGHKLPWPCGESDKRYQRLICLSSIAFWDAYLKDDPAARAWLTNGGLKAAVGTAARLEAKLSHRCNAGFPEILAGPAGAPEVP